MFYSVDAVMRLLYFEEVGRGVTCSVLKWDRRYLRTVFVVVLYNSSVLCVLNVLCSAPFL